MDLQAIVTAASGLKTAADIAKAAMDVKSAVDVQGKVFELQRVILAAQQDTFSAQQTQSALLQEKRQLEERIRELEAWDRDKQRYQLSEVGSGTFAYTLKSEAKGSEPEHMLCAHCFQRGRKSILQRAKEDHARRPVFKCSDCRAEIVVRGMPMPEPQPPRVINDYDPLDPPY